MEYQIYNKIDGVTLQRYDTMDETDKWLDSINGIPNAVLDIGNYEIRRGKDASEEIPDYRAACVYLQKKDLESTCAHFDDDYINQAYIVIKAWNDYDFYKTNEKTYVYYAKNKITDPLLEQFYLSTKKRALQFIKLFPLFKLTKENTVYILKGYPFLFYSKAEAAEKMNQIIKVNNDSLNKADKKYLTPFDFNLKKINFGEISSISDAENILNKLDLNYYKQFAHDIADLLIMAKALKIQEIANFVSDEKEYTPFNDKVTALLIDKIKKELTFHSQKSVDKINEMAEKISRNNENL